jgi:hypothetical protein
MSLLNLDELDSAVEEVARVLAPGGRFCFATLHPTTKFENVLEDDPGASYHDERVHVLTARRGGPEMTFHDIPARSRPTPARSRGPAY